MAGTIIATVKSKLVAMLKQRPGLNGVTLFYFFPGVDNVKGAGSIWIERASADVEFAALRAGRKSRNEDATFTLVAHVERNNFLDADQRVCELGQEIEECLADNTTLDGTVTGLLQIGISSLELRPLVAPDGAAFGSQLIYTVKYKARIL